MRELKKIKRERSSIDDIKTLFYDKVIETINDTYEEYRVESINELISIPYDNKNHMRRWVIYRTDAPYVLNKTVMRKIDNEWKDIYRKSIFKGTKGRVIGIKNKNGEIQVSEEEILVIKEIAKELIDQLLEDWFGS